MERVSSKSGVSRRGADAITMRDVARIAGVSTITVSRALSDPEKVSQATREKVNDAVLRTGYVPNLLAGALASNRSRLIAAAVPSVANPIYSEMLHSFNSALKGAGYQVLIGEYGHSEDQEEELVEAVLSRRPDGILLTGIRHSVRCRRMLMSAKVPVVEVWDMTDTPIDLVVGFSHEKVGTRVADYVIAEGYTAYGVVTAQDQRGMRRLAGFQHRLHEQTGREAVVFETESASLEAGREGLGDLIGSLQGRRVIFCSSDVLAHGVLTEAAARGLRVPADVAIVGFGDQSFAGHTFPALTSVRIDRPRIGRHAAETLVDRIAGRSIEHPSIDVGFQIIKRDTA